MKFSVLLPKHLQFIQQASTESELLALLGKKPGMLIDFLECVIQESSFVENYPDFLKDSYILLSNRFKKRGLESSLVERFVHFLQANGRHFMDILPKDLDILVGEHNFHELSFLFASASPFLFDRIYDEKVVTLFKDSDLEVYLAIREFIYYGSHHRISLLDEKLLFSLYELTEYLEMVACTDLIADQFKKFLQGDKGLAYLISSYKKNYHRLMKKAVEALSNKNAGVTLPLMTGELALNITRISSTTERYLTALFPLLTHLTVARSLCHDAEMIRWIERCEQLHSLDISSGNRIPMQLFSAIKSDIKSLRIEGAFWLDDASFRELLACFPKIERLFLEENSHLTYSGLSALSQLNHLKYLDITRCSGIDDRAKKIIEAACPNVVFVYREK